MSGLKIPRPIHYELVIIGTSGLGTNFKKLERSDVCIKQNDDGLVEVGKVQMMSALWSLEEYRWLLILLVS
jgi:hypothetical protein